MVMLDNTSNNTTTCQMIEVVHDRRKYKPWNAAENQLPWVYLNFIWWGTHDNHRCLKHVVNIANIAMMSHITQIAAVETAAAIWEYDPALPANCVLSRSLDVIAMIRTIAIKVRFNGWISLCLLTSPLDPSFWPTYRILWEATNSIQDQWPA